MTPRYTAEYQRSIEQPEAFWREKAEALPWFRKPEKILTRDEHGIDRWFADGEINTAYCALDHHVRNGRGEQTALIYDSPVTGARGRWSYAELLDAVARFAGGLHQLGIGVGDRVVLYMPMVPEAVIGMLACARVGAIHSVVFGGFAPHELAVRIDDAQPKLVLSASCGVEVQRVIPYKAMLDEALTLARHKPERCVILQRPQGPCVLTPGRDLDWTSIADAAPVDAVRLPATHPLYILYTSGTTGTPKGVVRDHGGHAVALRYSMDCVYGVKPGDVYMAASDVGWVVGHSYIVYAPLLTGCTTILYEGKPVKTPDAGAFWRLIEAYRINVFFTAPTAFRAIRKEDPDALQLQRYDVSSLNALFLAGERLDPPTYHWLVEHVQCPVIDHWWQTETGWAIAANPFGIDPAPSKAGSATFPSPGYNVQIVDDTGRELPRGQQGSIVIKLPLPPGCMSTIWRNPERFRKGYLADFPGFYLTGDGGYIDADGYLFVMGRTDDVINVAGHRLSTGEMEQIVGAHPAVAECAVIGVADDLKGQKPIGLVVTRDGWNGDPQALACELSQKVREQIGGIACYQTTLVVQRLPKTRSGKILRKNLRAIADGVDLPIPSTIEDPAVLDELRERLAGLGVKPIAIGH